MKPARIGITTLITPLVGREREAQYLLQLLLDHTSRLTTLTGPSGVGKTWLAQHVANTILSAHPDRFAGGIVYVSLAGRTVDGHHPDSIDLLANTVLEALQLESATHLPPMQHLAACLRRQSLLLIIDSVEYINLVGEALIALLHSVPELHVLAISLESLPIGSAHVVELQGLGYPLADEASSSPDTFPALALFTQVARHRVPEFQPDAHALRAIAQICRKVSGLPLAIELAAQWVHVLTCHEIVQELDRNLDFLVARGSEIPERHRNLRAAYQSSIRLLSHDERSTLYRLSVFSDSFTREAAKHIADASLAQLASLMDKSLLRRVSEDNQTVVRYEIPNVIRYFAREADVDDNAANLQHRHCTYYLEMLASSTAELRGGGQQERLKQLSAERNNLRVAWRWAAAAASPQDIIAAADGLFHLHDIRSWFSQGEAEFAAAVSALSVRTTNPTVTTALGKVMSCQAWFLFHLGHTQRAIALFNTALDMLRSANASVEMMFPLSYLGAVYVHLGDLVRGAQICSEGSRLARELENQYYQAIACNILGQAAYEQGDYPTARRWSEESLSIERALNNKWSMAFSLINLGKVALALGDFGRAEHLFYESLAIRDLLEDHRGSAICLSYLGNTALASGSLATAVVHFTNGLAFSESAGSPWCVANALFNLAKLDAIEGTQLAKLRILQTGLDIAVYIQAAPLIATGLSLLAQCAAPILPKHWGHTALAADMGAQCNIAEQFLVWANAQSSLVDMTLNSAIDLVVTHAHAARQHLVDRPMSWAQSHELTPREIEVLQLIMHGLADAQIAEQLVISRRTVSTHLTSIYSKLNVKSRTAAALLAMAADPLLIVSNSTSATT